MLKRVDRMVGYEPDEREQAIRKELLMKIIMEALKQQGYKVKLVKPKKYKARK